MIMDFIWDPNKAESNKRKHKVSFDEAVTVFYDDNALVIDDLEHSKKEERFIILGRSIKMRLVVVCHCFRESDNLIRIISARKANKKEKEQYPGTI